MSSRVDSKRSDHRVRIEKELVSNLKAAYSSGDKVRSISGQKHPQHDKKSHKDHPKMKSAAENSEVRGKSTVLELKTKKRATAESTQCSKHHLQKCQSLDQDPRSTYLPHMKGNVSYRDEPKRLDLKSEVRHKVKKAVVPDSPITAKAASSPVLIRGEATAKYAAHTQEAKANKVGTVRDLHGSAAMSSSKEVSPDLISMQSKPLDCHHSQGKRKKALLPNLLARNLKTENKPDHWVKNKSKSCESILDNKSTERKEVKVIHVKRVKDAEKEEAESPSIPPRLYLLDPGFASEIGKLRALAGSEREAESSSSDGRIQKNKASTPDPQSQAGTGPHGNQDRSSGRASTVAATPYKFDTTRHNRAHCFSKIGESTTLHYQPLVSSTSDATGQNGYVEVKQGGARLDREERVSKSTHQYITTPNRTQEAEYAQVRQRTMKGRLTETRRREVSSCSEPLNLHPTSCDGEDEYSEVKEGTVRDRLREIRTIGSTSEVKKPSVNACDGGRGSSNQLKAKLENLFVSKSQEKNMHKENRVRYI